MIYADLWKIILRHGIDGDDCTNVNTLAIRDKILTSTIIVDSRPIDYRVREQHIKNNGLMDEIDSSFPLALPFNEFWVEGSFSNVPSMESLMEKLRGSHDFVNFPEKQEVAGTNRWGCCAFSIPTHEGTDVTFWTFGAIGERKAKCFGGIGMRLNKNKDPVAFNFEVAREFAADTNEGTVKGAIASTFADMLGTLRVIGCKNIGMKPNPLNDRDIGLAEKQYNIHRDFSYHTLIVRAAGSPSDSPGIDIGSTPRHLCRGHFREYGPQFNKGLLFGRYDGRFYIPPHMKGDAKNGIVEKDYMVK